MRICSLLPSATEIVYALGFGDSLVAVTHECDYPAPARMLPRVTRTSIQQEMASREIDAAVVEAASTGESLYQIDGEMLERLRPDLILTQQLCEVCAVSVGEIQRTLRNLSSRPVVLNLEPRSLAGILENIIDVARATDREQTGRDLVRSLSSRIERVRCRASGASRPRVFCMEWADPVFCGGHWMKELVDIAGGRDDLARLHEPSMKLPWDAVLQFAPEVMVLTCCGFDVARGLREIDILAALPGFDGLPAVQAGRVYVADAMSYFSRPGPRIVESLEILAHLIHPEIFDAPALPGAFASALLPA